MHALLLDLNHPEALAVANATAAISVTGLDGWAALLTRPELEASLVISTAEPLAGSG
ncbi:hypothetical protein DFAR_3190005 [Desulfarculales bacterium]